MITTTKPGRIGRKRFLRMMAAGLVLVVALAASAGADSGRGHGRHGKGSQGRERHSYQESRHAYKQHRGPVCSTSRPVYVARRPVYVAPRRVYVTARPYCGPRRTYYTARPWWVDAPRIEVNANPYYFNASLGFYVDGAAVQFDLGNVPPDGCVWYDPYCHQEFTSMSGYRSHCDRYDHAQALSVTYVSTRH